MGTGVRTRTRLSSSTLPTAPAGTHTAAIDHDPGASMNPTISLPAASEPGLHPRIRSDGVLLVEDCSVHRCLAVDLLREAGVTVIHEAVDGLQALLMLNRLQPAPAVVVLDLNLPKLDGIDALRILAERPAPPAILILSGSDASVLESIRALCRELKLQLLGVIQKPINEHALCEALTHFVDSEDDVGTRAGPETGATVVGLFRALQAGCIVPHYQPKFDLTTGQLDGFEVLARWRTAAGEWIPPASFIAVAEESDQIDELTHAIVDRVLADLTQWETKGFRPRIAINVSRRSLSSRAFTERLLDQVERAGIAPGRLTLEVTESAVTNDPTTMLSCVGRLRMRGFGVSIDDYGTGLSSLQQLARLPFSEIKIDRSFVNQAQDSEHQRTILALAVDVGKRLGLSTVAEGIETADDLATVIELGCDIGQGYLFGKAMAAEAVLPWCERDAWRATQLCSVACAA